ncbi:MULTISPECIES: RNA polymerase sigma factor [Crateriforma]|uniref:RNA polymerase sigma factor YlaC n=1 Tax=Crateriforma conspicua TaxID=2527996 RepID=A0A5C6FJ85_9PLAN|nr:MULTISPECIES: sigma-70 family RNA polymerase sigma factor [Crateriforma]TWU62170.1 RNA polymerase sigma factor YlaC [Crateriforma conspicua]
MNIQEQTEIFDDWVRQHRGLLFKIVRSYSRDRHDQEDLMQELLVQVWRSVPGFKGQSAVSTWLYRVGLYSAIAWSKRDAKQRFNTNDPAVAKHLIQLDDQPSDTRLEWIYDQINKLDEIDRSIALMWLDDRPYQEIAGTLGITSTHVGVKLNRIKQKLSEALQRESQR